MKKWFVICTRPRQELKVADRLTSIGIKNFCPTVNILKQYSDRKKKIKRPLLSTYIMVLLENCDRVKVFSIPGVVRYLFFLGKPVVVSQNEINQINHYIDGVFEEMKSNTFSIGSNFKIPHGPFSGLSGNVIESNKSRVKLLIKSLGINIILKKQAA